MTVEPVISVIIPLYNKRATILRAVCSVIDQGVEAIEVIVVDDGSTDGSAAKLGEISDPRVRLVSQANAGPGRARNVGAAEARAPLLAFLDADDEWMPGFLAAGLAALEANPDAVAYATGCDTGAFAAYYPNHVACVTSVAQPLPPPSAEATHSDLMHYLNGLHSSSTIVRTDIFRRFGGFYDATRCLWGEDSYLWAQVLFAGAIFWEPSPRVLFHVADSSLGFAVSRRTVERPLSSLTDNIVASVPPDHRDAFRKLAKALAKEDARDLMDSGTIGRALSLRVRHRIPLLRALAGDARRCIGTLRRRAQAG